MAFPGDGGIQTHEHQRTQPTLTPPRALHSDVHTPVSAKQATITISAHVGDLQSGDGDSPWRACLHLLQGAHPKPWGAAGVIGHRLAKPGITACNARVIRVITGDDPYRRCNTNFIQLKFLPVNLSQDRNRPTLPDVGWTPLISQTKHGGHAS